jgi:hypothetical protein
VLRWDFSVDVSEPERIVRFLHNKINESIMAFVDKHKFPFLRRGAGSIEKVKIFFHEEDALSTFKSLVGFMKNRGLPLFILIDEHDRFANKLLFENPEQYNSIVAIASGTKGSSFLRSIFEAVKEASGFISAVKTSLSFRVFTVGLGPMALSDASGANIFEDVTHRRHFAEIVGFRQSDLPIAVDMLIDRQVLTEILLALMREYFDGYRFVPDQQEGLYNPQLCLHLLKYLLMGVVKPSIILSDKLDWNQLVDPDVKLSENVFKLISYNPLSASVVVNLKTGPIGLQQELKPTMKMEDLQKVEAQSNIFLLSLMYYQGMVTFDSAPALGRVCIPNRLAEFQFLDRLAESLTPSVETFLRTLDPLDLQTLLRSVLAISGPTDDTFNERCPYSGNSLVTSIVLLSWRTKTKLVEEHSARICCLSWMMERRSSSN